MPANEWFNLGADSAAITHGHPVAQAAAGVFAVLISLVAEGRGIPDACAQALEIAHGPQTAADPEAVSAVAAHLNTAIGRSEGAGQYGDASQFSGWKGHVAEEALAIGVWAANSHADLEPALALATEHGGEQRTTGAICGAIWGARTGASMQNEPRPSEAITEPYPQLLDVLPQEFAMELEGREVIETVAEDFSRICQPGAEITPADQIRWPGW